MVLTTSTYEQTVLAEPGRAWELHDGELREKPAMSVDYNHAMYEIVRQLAIQLDPRQHEFRMDAGRTRHSAENYFIPDVMIVPRALVEAFAGRASRLEIYREPLPFVAEVWSPSTGGYDVDAKFPEYRRRGDREIWRMYPYGREVTMWRLGPDGQYAMTVVHGGVVPLLALPDVIVDIDDVFRFR